MASREHDAARAYHFLPRKLRRLTRKAWLDVRHYNDKNNALPDFYVIGSMKSGTTTLYMHLESHPEVYPATLKEVHYFNTHRDLGERFFRSHFPARSALSECSNSWGRQIVGEATPDYIFHPAAPAICHGLTPNARFVLLMRNPVDRAFSHWKQGKRFEFESESFDRAIALEEARLSGESKKLEEDIHYYSYRHQMYSYLARGRYAEQINRWLNYFDPAQFLFIRSEDMFEDGNAVFKRVTDFLGLSAWSPKSFDLKFKGLEGDIPTASRSRLSEYYEIFNQELYEIVGEDYGWK